MSALPRYSTDHTVPELRGKLMSYAWPGGYPIYYLTEDSGVLCPNCANGDNGSEAHTESEDCDHCPDDRQWLIVAADIHWEGPPMDCDHCGGEIESAYGDPDAETRP